MAITLILREEYVKRISSEDVVRLSKSRSFRGDWWIMDLSPKCTINALRTIRGTRYFRIIAPEQREYYVSEVADFVDSLMHQEEWLRMYNS